MLMVFVLLALKSKFTMIILRKMRQTNTGFRGAQNRIGSSSRVTSGKGDARKLLKFAL